MASAPQDEAVVRARQQLAAHFGLDSSSPWFLAAITHPSFAHESPGALDNQRLEFLGDAILDFLVSAELFDRFPDAKEGQLTKVRATLVNTEALSRWARAHDVGLALRFGKGAGQGQLHQSDNVLADAVEALIAASFRENGIDAAKQCCADVMDFGLRSISKVSGRDTKSELQERVQALGLRAPTYEVISTEGPAHESMFEVAVQVDGEELGRGRGRSKRLAEREAASVALRTETFMNLLDRGEETS